VRAIRQVALPARNITFMDVMIPTIIIINTISVFVLL
jgi:hypothetical protein